MWGECILYMPATASAKRMSDEYFYEQELYKEQFEKEMELRMENERLRMENESLRMLQQS